MRLFSVLLAAVLAAASPCLAQDIQVKKLDVIVPPKEFVAPPVGLKKQFPQGFPTGVGSGLCFSHKEKDGALIFLALTDRGPNADAPDYVSAPGEKGKPAKIFPAPGFHPSIATIRVKGNTARVTRITPIRDTDGKPVTGLPTPKGEAGSTGEVPLDAALKVLPFDVNGLDPEGIAMDRKRGTVWMSDEYGPFMMEVDPKTGRILRKLMPGKGLPTIIAKRVPNRGAEGLAVTPSGKVVLAVQSILDTNGKVKESKADFTRLVEYDPVTDKTRMLAYPIDADAYKKTADAKIGDLTALTDTLFLIVEQAMGKDKKMRNLVYLVDISKAAALPDLPLETTDGLKGMTPARKTLVADLRALGWEAEKAEGLTIVDERTIALCSDNDFGMAAKLVSPAKGKDGKDMKDVGDYSVGPDGKLMLDGKAVDTRIEIKPSGEKTALWILTLPRPILDYQAK